MMKKYQSVVIYSWGNLGDHVTFLDLAIKLENIFDIKTVFILKSKNSFLEKFYNSDYIRYIYIDSFLKFYNFFFLVFKSIFSRNLFYIRVGPRPGMGVIVFSSFIKIFTISDICLHNNNVPGFFIFKYFNKFQELPFNDFNNKFLSYFFNAKKDIENVRAKDFLKIDINSNVLKKYNLQKKEYLIVVPGTSLFRRSLKIEDIDYIINYLIININKKIILVGTLGEIESFFLTSSKIDLNNSKIVNLMGKSQIEDLFALIKNASLVIGANTGLTLIAYFLDTKSLVFSEYHDETKSYWVFKSASCRFIMNEKLCKNYVANIPLKDHEKTHSCCLEQIDVKKEFLNFMKNNHI